jgi:hypothetical protein
LSSKAVRIGFCGTFGFAASNFNAKPVNREFSLAFFIAFILSIVLMVGGLVALIFTSFLHTIKLGLFGSFLLGTVCLCVVFAIFLGVPGAVGSLCGCLTFLALIFLKERIKF